MALARRIAEGPSFAHGITKTQLNHEWSMGLDQAIEAEAQAQAICMQTRDFRRAYEAFVAKERPCSRATDGRSQLPRLALLRGPPPRARRRPRRLGRPRAGRGRSLRHRRGLPRPRGPPRGGGLAAPQRGRGGRGARRARAVPDPRDARAARRARRLRLRHAGARHRPPCRSSARPSSANGSTGRARGRAIAAFALTEPRSGSDVARIELAARRDGDDYVLDGEKTWISNGGIADLYTVFARTGEGPGAKGLSAFAVPADTPGPARRGAARGGGAAPARAARLRGRAPARQRDDRRAGAGVPHRHVGARRVPLHRRGGGAGLRAPRARGHARPGCAAARSRARRSPISRWCRAMWPRWRSMSTPRRFLYTGRPGRRDMGAPRVQPGGRDAKLFATDRAQDVIDRAGAAPRRRWRARGRGHRALYREIRALRIYEGASDVQRIVIARQTLANG